MKRREFQGISSTRRVVGQYTKEVNGDQNSNGRGFVWDDGVDSLKSINVWEPATALALRLGQVTWADSTYAHGINDSGFLVGECKDHFGTISGFIMNVEFWQNWGQPGN